MILNFSYLNIAQLQNLTFPRKNEVYSVAVCTKFLNQTVVISLDILKELETNFKMRYDRLKSEDGPLGYSIFKKGHKSKNPAELLNIDR